MSLSFWNVLSCHLFYQFFHQYLKRDEFEEQVEEHLRKKLSLIEREPPVLEEVTVIEEEEESNEFIGTD